MSQRGRNAGVTGLFDIQGTPQFACRVWNFSQQFTLQRKRRRGRGVSGKLALSRALEVGAQLVISGDVTYTAFPMPATFEGSAGTVTLQFDTGKTCTLQVEVDACSISYDEKRQEWWRLACTCTITAQPVFAGWAQSQPTATPPALANAEILEQGVKSVDPQALADSATRVWDVVALTDSDAGELATLTDMIAAAVPPYAGMQLRSIALTARDACGGGTVTETWTRTTTAQDQQYQHDATAIDPQHLADSITLSEVFANASPPADPEPPAGMVLRQKLDRPLTPDQSIRIYAWAYTSTKDEAELPHRRTGVDPDALEDQAVQAQVYLASGAAPDAPVVSGLKLRAYLDLPVASNPAYSVRVWTFARTTSGEDILNRETQLATDPSGLETTGKAAAWNATPANHAGLVTRREIVTRFNDGRELHVLEEGLESIQDQRERTAGDAVVDPSLLVTEVRLGIIAQDQPATPAAPAGTVYHSVRQQKQEDGRSLWTFLFRPRDSRQEIEFESALRIDPDDILCSAELVVIQATDAASPPAAPFAGGVYQSHARRQLQANPARYQYTYSYGFATTIAKIQAQQTSRAADAGKTGSNIRFTHIVEQIAVVSASDTPPATPEFTDPDAVLAIIDSNPIPENPSYWVHLFKAAYRTTSEQLEDEGSEDLVDAASLGDATIVTVVDASPTPTAPGVAGKTLVRTLTRRHGARWAHRFTYGWETEAQKLAREATHSRLAVDGVGSEAQTAAVDDTPPAPPAGLAKAFDLVRPLPNNHALNIAVHDRWGGEGLRQAGEETRGELDLQQYERWHAPSLVSTSDLRTTLQTTLASLQTDPTFDRVSGRMLAPDQALVVASYASADKILRAEFRASREHAKALGGQVSIAQLAPLNATWSRFLTAMCEVYHVRGTLSYQRKISTADWTTLLHYDQIGFVNNGVLFGLAAGTLMYVGPRILSNEYITGAHVRTVEFCLEFDNYGFPDHSRVGEPGLWYTTDAAIPGLGYFAASDLGWTVALPAQVDLGFVLA